jgi:hypothetical protein
VFTNLLTYYTDFSININMVINKCFKMLGFILRNTREFKNVFTLKMLYCSLVRSHTEFGSIIWAQNCTDKLFENVQYKFLKSIAFCLNLPISRESFTLVANSIIFSLVRSGLSYLTSYLFMIF